MLRAKTSKPKIQLTQDPRISELTLKVLESVLSSSAAVAAQVAALQSWADIHRLPQSIEITQTGASCVAIDAHGVPEAS